MRAGSRLFRTFFIFVFIISLISSSWAGTVQAPATENGDYEWPGIALGLKVGTLGPGADLTIGLIPERLNFRLNANYLKYSYEKEISDINYDIDLDFSSLLFMLDWHPFANNFRISAGGIRNDSKTTVEGTPTESVTIGDHKYPPGLVGSLSGKVDFQDWAPYIGIGFGDAVDKDVSFSFIFDLGVIIQTVDVTLTANGPAQALPGFQEDLKKQEVEIEDDLNALNIYPVLAFGIAYYF